MKELPFYLDELDSMKQYPKTLYYSGNTALLKRKKISIVGSRKPTKYSRYITMELASALGKKNFCIVSGGAMGIDATAHLGATASNTIAVLPCGIDLKYPAVNKNLLNDIEKQGLLLSQFDIGFQARAWSFVVRNELVVALGDILIVSEADKGSGTMRSVEYALKMGKEIYVLSHRIGESEATQELVKNNQAKVIYNISDFVSSLCNDENSELEALSEFELFCKSHPSYEEGIRKYPTEIFEAELNAKIKVSQGKIFLL